MRLLQIISACSALAALYFGCLDEITQTPPCFLDGSTKSVRDDVISVNICCDAQADGTRFCKDFFREEGYGDFSELAQCTDAGYCRLCEAGVDCFCLGDRDCPGEACVVTDDAELCQEASSSAPRRCSVCVSE